MKSIERTAAAICSTILIGITSAAPASGQDDVLISEIQAVNRSTVYDEDGDLFDWFELLNAGSSAVNMNGWTVTDDPNLAAKWRFPAVTIPPGGFLVVFASNKNRRVPSRKLHTNFRLNRLGEFLGLYDPDGNLVHGLVYPALDEDYSYGLSQNGTFGRLVPSNAPARAIVPSSGSLGTSWTDPVFDDGSWRSGTTGVGYDRNSDYRAFIDTDIRGDMEDVNTTAYIRVPFEVADPNEFSAFFLRMRYDDGFVAYINGTRVASRNAPSSPTWNSSATGLHDDNAAVVFEDVALDEVAPGELAGLLRAGTNVLAIHGLNDNIGSSDFLIMPELDGLGLGELERDTELFFPNASPGTANLQGFPGVARRPTFSRAGGLFTGNLSLSLDTDEADGEIRYTTNGGEPTESSTLYTGPLNLTGSTLIRARTFVDGIAPSPTVTEGFVGLANEVRNFTSNLPVVVIENFGRGGIPSDPHQPAFMAIFEPVAGTTRLTDAPTLQTRIGIKRRGSSTSGRPKASFTVEAWDDYDEDKNIEPLGMPRESDWVLYGAYNFDRAHMRNPLIYELSNQVGRWAARSKFCEVFLNTGGGSVSGLNSDYFGIYSFMEKIKRGPDRIDVEALDADDTAAPKVQGGYMVKIDRLDPGDSGFGAGGRGLGYVYPKEERVIPEQENYIRDYINTMINTLNGANFRHPTNGYRRYLDPESWVDHHILNVLAKNVDALRLSTYMFKGRYRRYEFGPIWDFDRSMESTDGRDDSPTTWNGTGDGTNYFTYPWWDRLFDDPDFWQLWIDRWQIFRRGPLSTSNVSFVIDNMTFQIRSAQPRDQQRWGQTPRFGGFQGEVDHLKSWLQTRSQWIDGRFVDPPVLSPPGRPIVPGFALGMSGDGEIYYTIDGRDPRAPGGAVAAYATRYTGTINLDANARVFARVLGDGVEGSDWSGPTDETYVVETPRLVVSEIMYHPAAPPISSEFGAEEFEFIELVNASTGPIELAGAALTAGVRFEFADDEPPIGPGEFIVVVRNLDAFGARYDTTGMRIGGEYAGHLASEGELIELIGPLHEPILRFVYSELWFPTTDGSGESLNIIDPSADFTSWNSQESWSPSSVVHGTPGEGDPGLSTLGGRQRPGDSNQDGRVDISDAVSLLRRLFVAGSAELPCEGAALDDGGNRVVFDTNGDDAVDVSDALFLLRYLFAEGPPPADGETCFRVEGCESACF